MALTDSLKTLVASDVKKDRASMGNRKAHVLALCSQKGGVGKTTTAVNLSAALALEFKQRVLLIDLDPQGHVEKSLGALVPDGLDYTPLSEILTRKNTSLLNGIVDTEWENLSITPGDKTLYESEGLLASKIGRELILKNALKEAATHYDVVIMDCPPNLGTLTLNALVASDACIVPCEMSVLAFEGVSDLLETLETIKERLNPKLDILGVVFTRVDGRNVQMNTLIEQSLVRRKSSRICDAYAEAGQQCRAEH